MNKNFLQDKKLSLFFFLSGAEGIAVLFALLGHSSEVGSQALGKISWERGVFALLNALLLFSLLAMGIWLIKSPHGKKKTHDWLEVRNARLSLGFALASIGFFSLVFLLPAYRLGRYLGYFEQIYPSLVWFGAISIQALLLLFFSRTPQKMHSTPALLFTKAFWFIFSGLLLLWAFIASTKLGIAPDDRYWNEAGMPLLNEQILWSGILAFLLIYIVQKKSHFFTSWSAKKTDGLLFLLLWAAAAFFWIREPLPKSFFAVGPYSPLDQLFPYVDAAYFDIGGQFALIGQGLFNGHFMDRALISGILAIFHLFVGQNYADVVALQTLVFSVLPAILYLIGTRLHSRLLGIFLAVLFIFKGINAIAISTILLSTHSKFMLTGFPTSVFLAIFIFGLVKWYKAEQGYPALVLAGSALSVGMMLRTHLLLFLPLVGVLILLKYRARWKQIILVFSIFLAAFLAAISPWMWRSAKVANAPFFFLKSFSMVMDHRYPTAEPDDAATSAITESSDHAEIESRLPLRAYKLQSASLPVAEKAGKYPYSDNFIEITANHFTHNLVTSFFMLPTTPRLDDLRHTIKEAYPYWNRQSSGAWNDGRLTTASKIGVTWNLFLLALGIYTLLKKEGVAALIPLFTFLFYHAANAVARTSGGRYLVPVDWVLALYYLAGLLTLIFFIVQFWRNDIEALAWLTPQTENSPAERSAVRGSLFALLPFFALVLSITFIDQRIPPRYPDLSKDEIVSTYLADQNDFTQGELEKFTTDEQSRVLLGRALYPRFYEARQGEPMPISPAFTARDYPRFAFKLLGNFTASGQIDVMLPLDEAPETFPNGADIILLGCKYPDKQYIQARFIFVLDGDSRYVVQASNATDLTCR